MIPPSVLQKLEPVEKALNAYIELQNTIRARREHWRYVAQTKVRNALNLLVEVHLHNWQAATEDGLPISQAVYLQMPNRLPTELTANPEGFDKLQPVGGTLYFKPTDNGRIAILHFYPYFVGQAATTLLYEMVDPESLSPESVCQHVANYIQAVAGYTARDLTNSDING